MTTRFQTFVFVCCIFAFALARPTLAQGCFAYTAQTRTISVAIGGTKSADLRIDYYEELAKEAETKDVIACEAWINVPLSAFPTVRLATRPGDVAAAIRHVASEWDVRECRVRVWRENDVEEEPLSSEEQCIAGDFRFESGSWWPSSSEQSCDELES